MSIGTLIRVPDMVREISPDNTRDSIERQTTSPEEQLRQKMLERSFGRELYFREPTAYYADTDHFNSILSSGYMLSTSESEWGPSQPETLKTPSTIWDSAKLIELLEKPLGSPIELTLEEANEIVRLAAGRRPDLPPGKDYQKEVRELLGHSIADRIEKAE